MASPVLDKFAVLVFLFKEKGHQKVMDLFEAAADNDEAAQISALHWTEVGNIVERKVGSARWHEVRATLVTENATFQQGAADNHTSVPSEVRKRERCPARVRRWFATLPLPLHRGPVIPAV